MCQNHRCKIFQVDWKVNRMAKAIFELILAIVRLIVAIIAGFKFISGDRNETKTIYYGILILFAVIGR